MAAPIGNTNAVTHCVVRNTRAGVIGWRNWTYDPLIYINTGSRENLSPATAA